MGTERGDHLTNRQNRIQDLALHGTGGRNVRGFVYGHAAGANHQGRIPFAWEQLQNALAAALAAERLKRFSHRGERYFGAEPTVKRLGAKLIHKSIIHELYA